MNDYSSSRLSGDILKNKFTMGAPDTVVEYSGGIIKTIFGTQKLTKDFINDLILSGNYDVSEFKQSR